MKILLVNLHSAHNAGDNVLLRSILGELRRTFPGCTITLSMNDPASYGGSEAVVGSFTSWFKEMTIARNRWKPGALLCAPWLLLAALLAAPGVRIQGSAWRLPLPAAHRALLDSYAEADIIISNAGGYIYSSGTIGLPLLLTLATIAYGALLNKPVFTMPQSIGPLTRAHEFALVRAVLHRTQLTLLRDEPSAQIVAASGAVAPNAVVVPDLAFLFAESDEAGVDALFAALDLPAQQTPLLGVTVINWSAQNQRFHGQAAYEKAVADAVRAWVAVTHGTAIFFPQVCGPLASDDDRVPARRVAALLPALAQHVRVVETALAPPLLRSAYGRMALFLGTRLHSNIFALTTGVPIVAIAYQAKTPGTLRLLDLAEWTLPIESCDDLPALLMRAWDERAALRAQILTTLPGLIANTAYGADMIRASFDNRGEA